MNQDVDSREHEFDSDHTNIISNSDVSDNGSVIGLTSAESSRSSIVASDNHREGTITSARINILATMVGGGILSFPLAFYEAGNGLLAPLLLYGISALIEYSVFFLVQAGNQTKKANSGSNNRHEKGALSYESVTTEAFGPHSQYLTMILIFSLCFFGVSVNGILLRDMLLPISDFLFPRTNSNAGDGGGEDGSPSVARNVIMLFVIMIITPLCTLKNLTALKHVCVLSMISILTLCGCISYRSAQCNFSSEYDHVRNVHWTEYISSLPPHDSNNPSSLFHTTIHQLMSALPIFIGGFFCHFNVLTVHNELQDPSPRRVKNAIMIPIRYAAIFYILVGFCGSMYGNCTDIGRVDGNVLLNFAEDDRLLLLGRSCLSLTIAFAFPLFVAPARDVVLRALVIYRDSRNRRMQEENEVPSSQISHVHCDEVSGDAAKPVITDNTEDNLDCGEISERYRDGTNDLIEPLLNNVTNEGNEPVSPLEDVRSKRSMEHGIVSIAILWLGSAIACYITSVDQLLALGGSIAMLICFIIPSAAYLSLVCYSQVENDDDNGENISVEDSNSSAKDLFSKRIAWIYIVTFVPIMLVCGGNALYMILC